MSKNGTAGFAGSSTAHGCGKNRVRLAGVECLVTECSAAELRCTVGTRFDPDYLGADPETGVHPPYPSTFGLRRRLYGR